MREVLEVACHGFSRIDLFAVPMGELPECLLTC